MDDIELMSQPKIRDAEIISPPNKLKQAVGAGGIDQITLRKAQSSLDNTVVDFIPIAENLVESLSAAYNDARNSDQGESTIEAMIHPAMQLKAQGGMFKYQLITDVCNILVNFLETVENTDSDVLDIVEAHLKTINLVLSRKIQGDGGAAGKSLREALMDACNRYYRARSAAH